MSRYKSVLRRLFLVCFVLSILPGIAFGQSKSLNWFLEQAYNHDPQLASSQRNVKIARIGRQINRSMFRKPTLSGDGFALWAPHSSHWGFDPAVTNGGEFDALLNVTYPIWQGSNLKAYNMVSKAQSRQAGYNLGLRKHSLQMQVSSAFIQVYGDQQNISYLQDLHQLLQQQMRQLKALVQSGLLQVTDLEQIRLEDAQIQIQVKSAGSQLNQDQSSMNQLCGLPDTTSYQVNKPELRPRSLPDSLASIDRSHFLRSFSIDSLGLVAQQKVQDTQYLPQLNALVNTGVSTSDIMHTYRNWGFTAGLQFSWKLWDGGQKSLQHQQTKLSLENVRDQREFERTRLFQQRNSLEKTLDDLRDQIRDQEQQVNDYRNLLDTYRTEITKGIRTVTDYVTVFRQYLSARNTLNSLQVQRLQTINELNYWNW